MPRIEINCRGEKRTVRFQDGRITIGRSQDNDVVLTDKVASRRHCTIELDGSTIRLKDLDSHNGTWVGEDRITEVTLALGNAFRIGATFIRLLPDEDQAGAETEPSRRDLPTAQIVDEEPEDLPASAPDRATVVTSVAERALVSGPLSKQLAPLMKACVNVPIPDGAPRAARDIRLLNKKSEVVHIGKASEPSARRPTQALEALRQLMSAVFRTRATDLHIEPKVKVYALRLRIDGQLHSVGEITRSMAMAILNVVKILCDIDIAKKSVVQEGHFAVELPGRRVDIRTSFTPAMHGQKLALRFLDKAAVPDQFENLGMEPDAVAEFMRTCEQDSGMVILSGPTGSGKTTTLYTALQTLDGSTRHIVTIEDPVEYELPDATQITIDPTHNLTFASVLASVLRQDPDVILVGEIRDTETAKMAMQAATTGHLVFTTLHARDTVGTVFRLLDLGVESFLIANSISMCISQRLVRVLCHHCKRSCRPDAQTIRRLKLEDRPHGHIFEAVGCKRCMGVGYSGRMALFEMLVFNPQVRDVILTGPTILDIRKAAGEWMFQSLRESGYRKVIEGATTIQEVERVASAS